MIRKSLLTLALMALVGFVSAQSLQFEWNGHVYENDEVIVCDEPNFDFNEMVQHMQIRNLSDEPINVVVMKKELEMVEGSSNYFCWGMCYGSSVFVSAPVEMAAGAVSAEGDLGFHHNYDPEFTFDPTQWLTGTSVVMYTAYNERNEADCVTITVKFVYGDDSAVEENQISFSHAYPNPASSVVRFDVNCEGVASVALYNLLGQEVMTQNVENGQVTLPVADLNEGIYFCNLKVNGQVVRTEKFIVKK